MKTFSIFLIVVCLLSCTSKNRTTLLIKNDDVVKVVHHNFNDVNLSIDISKFDKEINVDKFSISSEFLKHEIITIKEINVFLTRNFNEAVLKYYKNTFDDFDYEENTSFITDGAKYRYIGNLRIRNNITSLLFLLENIDDNNSSYLILYNFMDMRLKSIAVLADQTNFYSDGGNESYYYKDYFIQLSNISRVEKDSCSSIFPKAFLSKVGINNTKCTFEYYSMFIIDEEGFLKFINLTE